MNRYTVTLQFYPSQVACFQRTGRHVTLFGGVFETGYETGPALLRGAVSQRSLPDQAIVHCPQLNKIALRSLSNSGMMRGRRTLVLENRRACIEWST